jgi:hypothetical protein
MLAVQSGLQRQKKFASAGSQSHTRKGFDAHIFAHQNVRFTGLLSPPKGPMAPDTYDAAPTANAFARSTRAKTK